MQYHPNKLVVEVLPHRLPFLFQFCYVHQESQTAMSHRVSALHSPYCETFHSFKFHSVYQLCCLNRKLNQNRIICSYFLIFTCPTIEFCIILLLYCLSIVFSQYLQIFFFIVVLPTASCSLRSIVGEKVKMETSNSSFVSWRILFPGFGNGCTTSG